MKAFLNNVRDLSKHSRNTNQQKKGKCDHCESFVLFLNEAIWDEPYRGVRRPITFSRDRRCEICSCIRDSFRRAYDSVDFDESRTFRLKSIQPLMNLDFPVLFSDECPEQKLYLLPLNVPHGEAPGRLLGSDVSPELAKKWLQCCESWHGAACNGGGTNSLDGVESLRVIDVARQCLVQVSPSSRYIALSYVWGKSKVLQTIKSNVEALEKEGAFKPISDQIPRTILDAMTLVQAIEERYLWVDALCIVQDDGADKMCLINQMDKIYKNALVTLVCASGNDANAGLVGFSRLRETQHIIQYGQERKLVIAQSPFANALGRSSTCVWNQRAWTHQERLLSSRTLVFLDEGMHFTCQKMIWSEDLKAEYETEHRHFQMFDFEGVSDEDRFMRYDRISEPRKRGEHTLVTMPSFPSFLVYCDLVYRHLRRQLTFEEDVMDSLAGILNHLSSVFGPFNMGLPQFYFSLALLWQPRDYCRRRRKVKGVTSLEYANFPSWSWAAWVFDLDVEHWKAACDFLTHEDILSAYRISPAIKFNSVHTSDYDQWHLYRSDDQAIRSSQALPKDWEQRSMRTQYYLGSERNSEYRFQQLNHDFHYPIPFHLCFSLVQHHSQEISFNADVATFNLSPKSTYRERKNAVSIVNDREEWCGIVFLHHVLDEDTRFDFIGISRGEVFSGSMDRKVFPELEHASYLGAPKFYRYQNAILSKRDDATGTYYRAGIGRIRHDAWEAAERHNQLVILG